MTDVRTSQAPSRDRSPLRRALRRAAATGVAALAAVALTLSFAGPASAEPSKEELKAQIDKMGKSLSAVVEKYNEAREKLKSSKKQAAKLNRQLRPMQKKVDALYTQTGKIASAAYKGGGAGSVDAVLSSGSITTMVDQMSTLERLAGTANKQIEALNVAKADLDKQKAGIDKLLGEQAKLEKDLAAKKKKIETSLDKLETTYEKVYGPLNPTEPDQDYGPPPYVEGKAKAVVDFAWAQLGEPYSYGAAGPDSWDCSGLVMGAYNQVGVGLPHSSRQQYNSTARVSRGDLMPGDIVFFYSDLHHDGIYIGNNTVIHAPQPGEYVEKISISAMPYAGAGRPNY